MSRSIDSGERAGAGGSGVRAGAGGSGVAGSDAAAGLPNAIMAMSPLGYWKLNETTGTTATDSSGNARHGTYVGTLSLASIAGPTGTGSYPNFQDDHVTIADNAAFSLVTAPGLTWFAMIKPDDVSTGALKFVVAKGNSLNEYEWGFGINSPGAGKFRLDVYRNDGTGVLATLGDTAILTTGWQAIAGTMTSNANSGTINIYRNSATPAAATPAVGVPSTSDNRSAEVWIGGRQDQGNALSFDGGIGHVAIFAGVPSLTSLMAAANAWLAL